MFVRVDTARVVAESGGADGDGLDDRSGLGSPLIAFAADRDRIREALDADRDNDGVLDTGERGPDGKQPDSDRDGRLDALEPDRDNDGVPDPVEAGHADPRTPPVDSGADGKADDRDLDRDNHAAPTGPTAAASWPTRSGTTWRATRAMATKTATGSRIAPTPDPGSSFGFRTSLTGRAPGDACMADDEGEALAGSEDSCPGMAPSDLPDFDRDGAAGGGRESGGPRRPGPFHLTHRIPRG